MHLLQPFACLAGIIAAGAARTAVITFENKCTAKLSVTGHKGESGTEPKLDIPACANLQPTKQCTYPATAGDHYQFFADHGWRTTARLIFDSRLNEWFSATDSMAINIAGGFDHPMRITATKNAKAVNCPAKENCNQTPKEVSIGGAFTVTFCPPTK